MYGSGKIQSKIEPSMTRLMIALEYLEGFTLAFHLSKKRQFHEKPFTEQRYLRMFKEFADALDYLHQKSDSDYSIIHRDLKPANIGFTNDGTLKLLDFGLSTMVRKTGNLDDTYQLT